MYPVQDDVLCLTCASGNASKTYDNWNITQVRDCATSLQDLKTYNASEVNKTGGVYSYQTHMPFNKNSGGMTPFTTWESYWSNADDWNCPVFNCTLFENDCRSKLDSENVYMLNAPPYTIRGKLNVDEGYNHTVCITCTVN